MRVPSTLQRLALGLALGAALMPAGALATTGISANDVMQRVESKWSMACAFTAPSWRCSTAQLQWLVTFEPESGPVTTLLMQAVASRSEPMDPGSESMLRDVLDAICAPGDVGSFVVKVGELTSAGTSVPAATITGCRLNGGRAVLRTFPDHHWITADVVAPPTPTRTPTPAPTPTPSPSPTLTPSPTPTASPSRAPSPTPTPTGSPGATPGTGIPGPGASGVPGGAATPGETSPSAGASTEPVSSPADSPAPGSTAPASPSGTPGPSPTGAVAGIQSTPEPGAPAHTWLQSVSEATGVSTDPRTTGVAALAVLLLLLAMGFVAELFNNTLESNYDRILAWWRNGPVGRVLRAVRGRGRAA